jgi:hypothetical protein
MTRRTISTITTAIAIVALAAPTALARPADQPAKATVAQPKQDGRARGTNVGAYTPGAIPAVSYPSGGARTPDASDAATSHKQARHPHATTGHPSETSGHPSATSVQSDPRPATTPEAPADPSIAWSMVGVGIAGLGIITAIAILASRTRRNGRARIAA